LQYQCRREYALALGTRVRGHSAAGPVRIPGLIARDHEYRVAGTAICP